ncbi:TMEM175 family protein [Myceligenerans indicum]|uniref:DUF1211 domain-containing protein n=1 Tax=Myceligenerans indicum TaxID=2593663 RepID=A0ABS1LGG3_9MICO|nr:TMEM175 family protein [Myceligenerans indicum]MBL0885321.1 DUF1211 domain-containing protein [Myceligenerans indicum]
MNETKLPENTSERLIAFLDAAIAIALTLLILPLMEGVSEATGEGHGIVEYFDEHLSQLVAFMISFVIIAMFWRMHHAILLPDTPADRRRTTLQFAWLFTIVVMPVVTALVGGMDTGRIIVACYIGTLAVSSLLLFVIAVVERRKRASAGLPYPVTMPAGPLAMAIGFALVLVLALIVPSYFWLFLMALTGFVRIGLIRWGVVGREPAPDPVTA